VSFRAVDAMERRIAAVAVTYFVEDEEFRFRPEERGVRDAGALQIRFRFLSDTARVAVVGLARDRINDRANQAQRRLRVEDVDPGRARIGNDEHVAGVDRAPAADARAVEAEAIGENILVIFGEGGGEMLPGARQ